MIFQKPKRLEKKSGGVSEVSLYRSICTSIFSTLLSLVMLVGTTFAWFTDSVTTGVFAITAGNLKTAMYFRTELPTSNETDDDLMWFPLNPGNTSMFGGMTFTSGASQTAYLKLKNEGNIDVKYKLSFVSDSEETGGTLEKDSEQTNNSGGSEKTTKNEKKLSEMLSFKFASADDVSGLKNATSTSRSTSSKLLADFESKENESEESGESSEKGPFEVTVSTGGIKYVALTIAMNTYDGTWTTQPKINLRLQIEATGETNNTSYSNDTLEVTVGQSEASLQAVAESDLEAVVSAVDGTSNEDKEKTDAVTSEEVTGEDATDQKTEDGVSNEKNDDTSNNNNDEETQSGTEDNSKNKNGSSGTTSGSGTNGETNDEDSEGGGDSENVDQTDTTTNPTT